MGAGSNTGALDMDSLRTEDSVAASATSTPATAQVDSLSDPSLATAATGTTSDAYSVDANAIGYQAQEGVLDETMSASDQLNKITSQDSPTMQRAKQQGMMYAAQRGLQNTSIAAGTAQGAMVDRALPLAQQDAATAFKNMQTNQEAVNRASEVSTGRETDISALNAELGTDVSKFNASEINDMEALNAQMETAVSQGNASEINRINSEIAELETAVAVRNADDESATAKFNAGEQNRRDETVMALNNTINTQLLANAGGLDIAELNAKWQHVISVNEIAGRLWDTTMTTVGVILADKDLTPAAANTKITAALKVMEGGLVMIDEMSTMDLQRYEVSAGDGDVGTTNPYTYPYNPYLGGSYMPSGGFASPDGTYVAPEPTYTVPTEEYDGSPAIGEGYTNPLGGIATEYGGDFSFTQPASETEPAPTSTYTAPNYSYSFPDFSNSYLSGGFGVGTF